MASTFFEPQPLSAPLTDRALASLENLANGDRTLGIHDKKLRDHLAAAIDQLTELTGRLNDRAYERRVRHEREQARRRQQQEEQDVDAEADTHAEDAEADQIHQQFQEKVDTLTKKMDLSIRAIIDDQTWLEDLPAALRHAATAARNTQPTQTQQTEGPTPIQSTRQSTNEEDEDEDEEAGQRDRKPATQVQPLETPHMLLAAALGEQTRAWSSKTLTERYAHHNDYKGFYRVLYDAKHPGESAPPMPDERLWFAAEEGRELISTQRQRQRHHHTTTTRRRHQQESAHEENEEGEEEDEDDDEIEIARESTRIKCPITLLPYVDPVTSVKCNHSYEKSAIQSMLNTTQDHVPFTSDQLAELNRLDPRRGDRARRECELRVPQVKCPECNVPLTAADLKPNAALKRRVQRLLERARREKDHEIAATSDVEADEEEDVDDGDGDGDLVPGTQRRPVGLGSSPVPPSSVGTTVKKESRRVKSERMASVVPQTQLSGLASPSRRRRGGATEAGHGAAASSRSRSAILDVDEDDFA